MLSLSPITAIFLAIYLTQPFSDFFFIRRGSDTAFDNMDYLNAQGDVVYLKASPETLYKHLLMAKVERPLIKGKSQEELIDYITHHLEQRSTYYEKAHYHLDVNVLDSYDEIKTSVEQLKKLLSL